MDEKQKWTTVIKSQKNFWDFSSATNVWKYKYLIQMMVKKYFANTYKQTILGPFWLIIKPLLTTLVFSIVFGNIAQLSTEGVPQTLFYMIGSVVWTLLSSTLVGCGNAIITNSAIINKVYFPRLIVLISSALCSLLNFAIQMCIFFGIYLFYVISGQVTTTWNLLLLPIPIIYIVFLSFGLGTVVAALTTKYRDLVMFLNFGIQLWMYATPVAYPLSEVTGALKLIMQFNPATPIIEAVRFCLFGTGEIDLFFCLMTTAFIVVLLIASIIIFNKAEMNVVDTI